MKTITLSFILFLASCTAKENKIIEAKKKNDLTWLITGLPDNHTNENIVAKLYGFQFASFGGCVVSNQLRDSIRNENEKLNKLLSRKFGKNWRVNFDKRVQYVNETISH